MNPTIYQNFISALSLNGNVPYNLTGLKPGTTYYFAFEGVGLPLQSTGGNIFYVYGTVMNFTTSWVDTVPASHITATSATLKGNIEDYSGDVTDYGFYWGTGNTPATRVQVGGSNWAGYFYQPLTGLTLGMTYFYQAYTVNPTGESKGAVMSFTTPIDISEAGVTGFVALATGATPLGVGALTPGAGTYTVTSITWQNSDGSPATLDSSGNFKASSAYQVQIVLTSAAGYKFQAAGFTPTVNTGTAGTGTVAGGDVSGNTFTFMVTFPATAAPPPPPVAHTVAVSANPAAGGTVSGGGTYAKGASVTVTATANSGYSFTNWTENGIQASTSAAYTFTMGAGDRNLTANFAANPTHTISYDGNGSTGGNFPTAVTVYVYGQTVTVLGNTGNPPLSKTGYTFSGWNTTTTGIGISYTAGDTFKMGAANVMLYAQWNICGVNVTLYYADTARNKEAGKTPDTVVSLPGINGFKPGNNANPQVSDAFGAYGFMVFPDSDYYIVANKDGYVKYTSPTLSVGQEIVKWNFEMHAAGTERLSGQDRVDTALAIARAAFDNPLSNVILATADTILMP